MVHFHNKKLALCCNKTQAGALVDITGTDDFTKWVGHSVTLTPARIDRERQTITITPAQASAPASTTPAAGNADGRSDNGADSEEGEQDTGS